MIDKTDWRKLAKEMSDVSEEAFYAGWMDELEFRLWEAVLGGPQKYGQIVLSEERLKRLRKMSDALGGWVWYNNDVGLEEFVTLERWLILYDEWLQRRRV